MNASAVKSVLLELVEHHNRADGFGSDFYHQPRQQHAMAEGKFLSSVSTMFRAQIISKHVFERMAQQALERLRTLALVSAHGTAFGLGFQWKDNGAETPFTITSAVVTEGLAAAAQLSEDSAFEDMAKAVRQWMTSDEILAITTHGRLPSYSPTDKTMPINVVAFWSSVLDESCREFVERGRGFVGRAYVDGVGWPYTTDLRRFDLLHTCYSARGVLDKPSFGLALAVATSRFSTPSGFIDKFDFVRNEEALAVAAQSSQACVQLGRENAYVLHAAPARPWSLGELLVLAAVQPGGETLDGYWRSVKARALRALEGIGVLALGPRDAMHVAHGLASTLEATRRRAD